MDPVTLAVTLSNFLPFQDDSTYETYITLTALTSTKYLAVSYIGSTTAPVGVTSQVISTSTLSNGTLVAKAFGVSSEFTGSRPNGVIRATALDENNVVVAYSDINSNYGITCVSLSINSFTGAVKYGAVLAITTGYTAKFISSGDININLVTIKAGSQFMLMFSDLSLNGALIAVIGQVRSARTAACNTAVNPRYLLISLKLSITEHQSHACPGVS